MAVAPHALRSLVDHGAVGNFSNENAEKFACEIAQVFEEFQQTDPGFARRSMYLAYALRHLHIQSVPAGLDGSPRWFFDLLTAWVKAGRFDGISHWGVTKFGPLDVAEIIKMSRAIDFSERFIKSAGAKPVTEFRMTFHRSCRGPQACDVSLSGLTFSIPLLKVSHAEISERVSFSMTANSDHVLSSLDTDLKRSKKFLEKRFQLGVRSEDLWEVYLRRYSLPETFLAAPLRIEINGILAKGSFAKVPIAGEPRSMTVFPGVVDSKSQEVLSTLTSPMFFGFSGTFAKVFRENIVISASYSPGK